MSTLDITAKWYEENLNLAQKKTKVVRGKLIGLLTR